MGKMSLSIYMKGDYEEFHALRRRKNKAKQSQFADLWPEIRKPKFEIRNRPCPSGVGITMREDNA